MSNQVVFLELRGTVIFTELEISLFEVREQNGVIVELGVDTFLGKKAID